MATITWIGGSSTSANTAANWQGGTKPAAGDVALFDNNATANCVWDIATPGGTTLSVDEIIVESTFATGGTNRTITLNTKPRIKGLFANGTIVAGNTAEINFISGFGSYKTYSNRYVLIGDNSVLTGLTFVMVAGTGIKFDDGQHPTVSLTAGTYGPDYETPTGTSGKASFTAFTITSGVTSFAPLAAVDANDRLKVFDFTAFGCEIDSFDAGQSTFEFLALSGGFNLPVTTSSFSPIYRKVVLKAETAGHKVVIADNSILTCDELEIQDGCMLIGPQGNAVQGSEIRTTLPPKIRGSWSYSQLSNGLYRSPKHAVGPVPKITALKMTGEIEATTITLNAIPADPATDTKVRIGESGGTGEDGNNMFMIRTNDGYLQMGPNNSGYAHIQTDRSRFYFNKEIIIDGGGYLYAYNDGLKLGTGTSSTSGTTAITIANDSENITVAGNIALGGTIDGRDLATDGSKLDGIEASATADQSNAEIRTAVEAATDSNVFTDADHTKLNDITASANNYTHPNHSGDVTSSGDGAITIGNDKVTYAKMQNVSATSKVLGRVSSGAGDVEELTVAQLRTLLNIPVVEIMKYNKTGTGNSASNLTYDNNSNQTFLVDIGSNQWVEDTQGTTHASMEITSDYGIKFNQTGIYQICSSFNFHSTSAYTGTTVCQVFVSTTQPDQSNTGWEPSSIAIDMGYNRFDVYLANQTLSIDPDFTQVFNITSADTTVWFYANMQGGTNNFHIRGHGSARVTDVAVTRIGNVQA